LDKVAQTWTKWDKLGQNGTNLDKVGQTWTKWDKPGQSGTNLPKLGQTYPLSRQEQTCKTLEKGFIDE
jgi:hypothetical protein